MSLDKSTRATSHNITHDGVLLSGVIDTLIQHTRESAKSLILNQGDILLVDGYRFEYKTSRQLIPGQPQSEITFDDELHILVDSGGMLEFCDWGKLQSVESKNYANYQAKLRSRTYQIAIGTIGDSTTYCQALPGTSGATNKVGQPTGFGDGSTHEQWQFNNNWPKVMGDVLQSAVAGGASVSNLGYSGDRALTGYLRHRDATVNDATIIMFGINDVLYGTSNGANPAGIYDNQLYCLSSFQRIMRKLIARELLRGKCVVVLGTTVFGSLVGWDGSQYAANRLTRSYDSVSKSVADEFGCMFVDVKDDILRQFKLEDILQEGTHLSEPGCKVMAGRLSAVMLSRWKTPTIVTATSTVFSNPNMTDMCGKDNNGVLPNSTSNTPPFHTSDGATISLGSNSVFYPVYVVDDSLIVFPEMIGSAAGSLVYFTVNFGSQLPVRTNPRELGWKPASSKGITLLGNHIDESNQNYSQDSFFVSLSVKGWHLLEVSKVSGSGSVLLDSFQFYSESYIKNRHTNGLTSKCFKSNQGGFRSSVSKESTGLFHVLFSSPMSDTNYQVVIEQLTGLTANMFGILDKTINGFKVQFMSAVGAGTGLDFVLSDPSDFIISTYGGR